MLQFIKSRITDKTIVIVDSKRRDLRLFTGLNYLNINEEEYSTQVSNKDYTNVENLFDSVVVTLGDKGAELRQQESNDGKKGKHYTKSKVLKKEYEENSKYQDKIQNN